ncbi:TldD/PmbA family protein [bacterium]|nr:TldD/PmbA family protein [bacterium]
MEYKYFDLLNWVEKKAMALGAKEVVGKISTNSGVEITLRDGEMETLKESVQAQLSLHIYYNNRYSNHQTNNLDRNKLEKFIQNAIDMTGYLAEDLDRQLPDPELYPKDLRRNLEMMDKTVLSISLEEKIAKLKEITKKGKSLNTSIISLSADYWDGMSHLYQKNSNGFRGETSSSTIGMGASVSIEGKDGKKPEGWKYVSTRYVEDFPSLDFIAEEAVKRAERILGGKKIASGRMQMLVKNDSVMRMLGPLMGAIRARSLFLDQSFLKDKLGQKIASDVLSITDDPFIKRGYGSRLFDSSGIASKIMPVIEKGVLKNYYIDNYYGRKLAMDPNASSASNWLFKEGEKSFDELLASVKKGIIVESFIGGNANNTTGDFSYGIVGQYVENGKIIHPVNEMNISGNMNEFLMNIVEFGNDPLEYSSKKAPSMLVNDIDFAGL